MPQATLFQNNRSQAVRLPAEVRFDADVKKVNIRVVGRERVLSPVGHSWDSFFLSGESVSEDFMAERDVFPPSEREAW